jgi:hypothetical protein
MIPVLLSFALQALYILVPIIPAVIIYRMFPATTTTVEGNLVSNWKVKAGGAFAAYIVTVLLGYFLAIGTQRLIIGMTDTTWTVGGNLELLDQDGKPISGDSTLLKSLDVEIHPPPKDLSGHHLDMRVPVEKDDPSGYRIHISIPEFGANDYSLDALSADPSYTVKYDRDKRRIDIGPNITIRAPAAPKAAPSVTPVPLAPLPPNVGPSPVASPSKN